MKLRLIYAVLLAPCVIGAVLTSGASAAPRTASTPQVTASTCVPNIHVTRYVGQTVASWTLKCAYSAQVFAQWSGIDVFGAKVHSGLSSIALQPTQVNPLEKASCAGRATYNSAGQQTSRVITYGKNC